MTHFSKLNKPKSAIGVRSKIRAEFLTKFKKKKKKIRAELRGYMDLMKWLNENDLTRR